MADSDRKSTPPTDDGPAEAPLTAEQEEALQKIMAELGPESSAGNAPADVSSAGSEEASSDELTSEQEEALKKIMAEIEGGDGSDTSPPEVSDQDPPSELADEQEENLNKIIAELQNTPTPADLSEMAAAEDETEPLAEEMSAEQEDALTKIMAEIEGRKPDEQPKEKAEAEAHVQPDDPLPPPQPAQDGTDVAEEPDAEQDQPADAPSQGLSQEDFESELQAVLAEAQDSAAGDAPAAPAESANPTDDMPEAAGSMDQDGQDTAVVPASDELGPADAPADEQGEKPAPGDVEAKIEPGPAADSSRKDDPAPAQSPSPGPVSGISSEPCARPKPSPRISKSVSAAKDKGLKKKKAYRLVAAATLGLVLIFGFLAFNHYHRSSAPVVADPQPAAVNGPAHTPSVPEPAIEPKNPIPPAAPAAGIASDAERLTVILQNIEGLRSVLLTKRKEIEALKDSYRQGISEVQGELSAVIREQNPKTYAKAVEDQRIELGLRTILRRQDYIIKLESPDAQLLEASEELLYLERKVDILRQMLEDTSGISLDAFERQAAETLDRISEAQGQLSIDDVAVPPRSLESVWNWVVSQASKTRAADNQSPLDEKANQQIAKEICSGKFEHKFKLGELTPETAQCLIKWNGKDMYLNQLSQLTPEAAKILSQWKGDWLGLNGLTSLSPEAARYLALWKGKHLSLNGLSELSPKATQYLSHWSGEQLELINLKYIGQWDNRQIKLFIPDKLRSQIPD